MLFTARILHGAVRRGGRGCHRVMSVRVGRARVLYALHPVIFNPDTHESSIYSLGNQRGDTR